MSNVHVFDHPLIQHKLAILRDKDTGAKSFRELVSEIAMLMCYEATRDLPLKEVQVETPMGTATCHHIAGKKLAVVPILRAGLGMVDGMVAMMPNVKVGHIGLYRDPNTLEPVKYYFKMPPDIQERDAIIVDPMLATGGSAAAVKIEPIGFLVIRNGVVNMLNIQPPASNTLDRIVDLIPQLMDKAEQLRDKKAEG